MRRSRMSASGQERLSGPLKASSALPFKADLNGTPAHGRLVPGGAIPTNSLLIGSTRKSHLIRSAGLCLGGLGAHPVEEP